MESVSDQDDLTLSAKVRCSDASSLWLVGRLSLLGPSRPMSVSEVGRVEPFLDLASCSSYRSRSPMYSTAYNSTAIQSFLLSPSLSTTSTTTVATAGGTAAMSFGSLHEVHNEVARNSLRQLQRRLSRRESLRQHERHDLGEINLRDGQKWEPGRNKRGLKLDLRPDSQAIHLDPDPGRAHNGATDTSVNGDPDSPSRMQLFAVCPGLLFDTRPMSSCSHVRSAHEPGSPMANVSSYLRISLDSSEPSMMTARDIATLSPTNQQKVSWSAFLRSLITASSVTLARSPSCMPSFGKPGRGDPANKSHPLDAKSRHVCTASSGRTKPRDFSLCAKRRRAYF